ncbi:hypothetical protein [Burkholderia gladioli]|uniref:hypothetical protein n=1 Tax=Burkholderia gladioli TaxID=28095 RepID=UPI0021523381|nr:hypothetical protein [Burkholderia gladioli]
MNPIPHEVPLLSIALLDSHELVRFALRTRIEQEPGLVVAGAFRLATSYWSRWPRVPASRSLS